MSVAIDAFRSALDESVHAEPWGEGELLVTPWEFSDHEPIVLYVRQLDGVYLVSDRGQASDNLALAGVDFAKSPVARSWLAVQGSVESDPFVQRVESKWEICGRAASGTELGLAIHQVAEAAMRADGLRVLAGSRRAVPRFEEWVIREASERGLSVLPRADVQSTVGVTRRVSALIEGRKKAYVQAVGPTQDPWDAYDRARSVFADARPDPSERFTVISRDSSLSAEQLRGIGQHSQVVPQANFGELLESVA